MKFCIVLALLASSVDAAPRDTFITTFQNLVSNYLGTNTGKAVDMITADVLALKNMDDITSHLMKEIIGLVPATKYLPAIGMLNTFTTCLGKTNSKMESVMAAVGGAFKSKLTPLLNKIQTKVKTMRGNKKSEADITTEGYNIANNDFTQALVQSVINACMTQCTAGEYACAVPPMNTIMVTSKYNMVYDAKRG